MSGVFISYARSTATQATTAAEALRGAGYSVWLDEDLPAHRPYAREIEAQLKAAKAALVIRSAEAVESEWVLSEANRAREDRKLVQLTVDGARLPMPFDQTQCADLSGWAGDLDTPGWRKVVASIAEIVGRVAEAVQAAAAPPPLPTKPSIAVLPFANLSGDPEQDYFADGMVVEITNALSRIRSIFVIASGSALSFKGKAATPQDVGRQLGVRYVLEGSVRKGGDRVRIAVQLIDAADGAQVWTHRFEDTLSDVFALQDKVALGVAGQIEPAVLLAEVRRASARPTENMGSYDLYLRAMPPFRAYTKVEMHEAVHLLDRAIALDPSYGLALGLGAVARYLMVTYRWSDDPEESRRQSMEMAHRALRAAGDDATVIATAAFALLAFGLDLDAALSLVDKAIALNPGSAITWISSGQARLRTGDADRAAEDFEAAIRLDPIGPDGPAYRSLLGLARLYQRRFSEAVALESQVAQESDAPLPYALLAASYGHLGKTGAAREALGRYRTLSQAPIEELARGYSRDPSHTKLFLDGIAMAEGRIPPDALASG